MQHLAPIRTTLLQEAQFGVYGSVVQSANDGGSVNRSLQLVSFENILPD
jgi:hypothetical protein